MGYATVLARASVGIEAPLVHVEAHVAGGLPAFHIVGMPETAVREARDRVRGALQNASFRFPDTRITISLAPADLPKSSGRFDLPIALAILAASDQCRPRHAGRIECLGELSLAGEVRSVRGVLPAARAAGAAGRAVLVPGPNAGEAALTHGLRVFAADHLSDAVAILCAKQLPSVRVPPMPIPPPEHTPMLSDVRGQQRAKRAIQIAAAGGHNLLMHGPPGTGKTMLARRLPALLPDLGDEEMLDVLTVASVAGTLHQVDTARPFRDPHHTASAAALVGGGSRPAPGEISLAHRGVLFLDEIAEFPRHVLDVLREPLETGEVVIARSAGRVRFPAAFQLVAAMNPCPAGRSCLEPGSAGCACTPDQVRRYRARLSAPLLDRIDLHVEVPPLPRGALHAPPDLGEAETLRIASVAARERAVARAGRPNARLDVSDLDRTCPLDAVTRRVLEEAMERLGLTARGCHRVRKVARTIADLEGSDGIEEVHLYEALAFREPLEPP